MSASAAALLKEATGFDDVSDLMAAVLALPPDARKNYLEAFLGSAAPIDELCDALAGSVAYRKEQDEPEAGRGRKPARTAAETAPVGGAKVKKGRAASARGLESVRHTMLPGRHACSCNARRHALLYNCLSCGKVICAQEGDGPCLFCGNDPHSTERNAAADAAAADAAARAARLLEFDRSAAKRTTVIDDQAD